MQLAEKLRKNFARNLAKLRAANRLTQAGLVDELNAKYEIGLKRASVANYEAEEAMPKIDALYCFADYFGKTIDQVISDNVEKAPLIYPWMLKERFAGPGEVEDQPESAGPKPENIPNLNAILKEYIDAISIHQFYVEFNKRFLHALQENAPQLNEPGKVMHLYSYTFFSCYISKSKFFQDKLEDVLQGLEYDVFRGFQEGSSIRMLSDALQMSEEEILATFNAAKSKVINAIDNTQNK